MLPDIILSNHCSALGEAAKVGLTMKEVWGLGTCDTVLQINKPCAPRLAMIPSFTNKTYTSYT